MTCRDVIEFLADYLAGDLAAEQQAVFDEHLAICPDCVAYLKNYRRTIQLGQAALQTPESPVCADIPEDLVQAILAARKKAT